MTGSERVVPLAGPSSVGGGGIGLESLTLKSTRLDGALISPSAFTASTRALKSPWSLPAEINSVVPWRLTCRDRTPTGKVGSLDSCRT